MVIKRLTLVYDPSSAPAQVSLEKRVGDFIMEWHYEDNFQEVLNMALQANNIPANVIKVGAPADTIAFQVQPFPSSYRAFTGKLKRGF